MCGQLGAEKSLIYKALQAQNRGRQFNFRVALGRMSEMGYGMMFGETTKDFFLKQIKGRGYVDVGTSVISEFYTPLVPKGHDFLKEIKKLIDSWQEVQAACEAKAAETD